MLSRIAVVYTVADGLSVHYLGICIVNPFDTFDLHDDEVSSTRYNV
jgi:hypothetical protein